MTTKDNGPKGTIEMCETPQIDTVEDLVGVLGAAVKVGCLTGVSEFLDHQGGVPARATVRNPRVARVVLANLTTIVISMYAVAPPICHYIAPTKPAKSAAKTARVVPERKVRG